MHSDHKTQGRLSTGQLKAGGSRVTSDQSTVKQNYKGHLKVDSPGSAGAQTDARISNQIKKETILEYQAA
jgi:hypothetical protein